jgi:transposase
MVTKKRVGAKVFIEFLKRLMIGQRRPIFLIVDGHPSHKAKIVQQFLKTARPKLKIFHLPPYSPDLNPDELVWNDVKNNGVARAMVTNHSDLKFVVLSRLRSLQKNPQKVRSFFQAESTKYAA